jgi:CRISPR-associated protein Cmr6
MHTMSTRRSPFVTDVIDGQEEFDERLLQLSPHAGLWLDKFIAEQERSETESRRKLVEETARISVPASYVSYFNRWQESLKDYCAQLYWAETQGRMLIGTGNESVLETAVTLHRTYGVPCIPGSALKGLTANFARRYCGPEWQKGSTAYNFVFGGTEEAGVVVFCDALPEPQDGDLLFLLHADVLTVHHREYYKSPPSAAPTDWDDPNPVPFISATGRYLIGLSTPKGCEAWRQAAFDILKMALAEEGVGAKTSSGYGRLRLT